MNTRKQFACDLAIRLVHDQYGDAVGKIFKQLCSKGQLSLPDLIRGTGMSAHMVKQSLLILIQQNCINAYLQPGEETIRGPRPSVYVYEALVDRVLQIIRYARFLLHIRDEAGEVAEHIVAQLLQEGRLRMDQVLGSVAARMQKPQEEVADSIRNTFISLVQAHYVERSAPCSLPPPAIRPHPNSVRQRKSRTAASGSEAYAADQAGAMRSFEEVSFDKQRFKVPAELALEMFAATAAEAGAAAAAAAGDAAGSGGEGGEAGQKADGDANGDGASGDGEAERGVSPDGDASPEGAGPAVGSKRGAREGGDELAFKAAPTKKAKMRAGTARPDVAAPGAPARAGGGGAGGSGGGGGGPSPVAEPAVVLWRVNTDEFNRRFRHAAMVALIREKFDEDAAAVVTAMLAAGRPFEGSVKEERSVQLSEEEVEATAQKLVSGGTLKSLAGVDVPAVLRTLANDSFDMFTHVGTGPQGSASYVVNSQRIMDLIMLKQVEAVVKCRYDAAGLRVFRLLALRGQLEQKQIADLAMLPPKDTRELLYRMLSGGFVMLQDIPKTNDRAPSRTFYTWRVHLTSLSDATAAQLYRAAGRVYQRLKHEMEKEKELLGLIETARETGTVTFTLTTAQRAAAARLKRVSEVMEASLQHLDEMIAIFNDF